MIEIKCTADNFKIVPIEKIVPNPKNNNRHSIEQINAIAKLIKAHGFREPLTISNRSGFLNCGHARLEASITLGMTELPVIYQDFSSEAEEYQHMTADNEIARWAELDYQGVYDALKEIPDIDTSLLGIEDFKLPEIVEPQADEDDVPEARPEPKVVRGEVYILGNHRLMCGDSTAITDVEMLMNGEKADMVFTDPPYGVSYEGGHNKKKRTGIENDTLEGSDLTDLFYGSLINAVTVTKDHSAFYVWYANGKAVETFSSFSKLPLNVRSVICWYKIKSGLGAFMSQYIPNYEPCIYAFKDGCSPQWFGPTDEKTVWELKKESKNEYHPTQKPVELPIRAINNSSKSGDIVLDLFGGSGSTLIGCESTGRNAVIMELDPIYCGVILDRWQKFTGKKAHREDGKPWDEIKEAN